MSAEWNEETKNNFDKVINNLPQFHRSIAEKLVKEKSEELAEKRGSNLVEDKDMVRAFFQEVPPAFKDMMKRLFGQLDIEYGSFVNE